MEIISREKFYLPPPPLTFLGGGEQEKCVLYSNNKKLTLPTGWGILYEIKKEIYQTIFFIYRKMP